MCQKSDEPPIYALLWCFDTQYYANTTLFDVWQNNRKNQKTITTIGIGKNFQPNRLF